MTPGTVLSTVGANPIRVSCLSQIWWLPYFANNAFTARGLRDLSRVWNAVNVPNAQVTQQSAAWKSRSKILQDAVIASIEKNIRRDTTPPYIGPYAGAVGTVWESRQTAH